jgi:hypothetical protein
MDMGSDHKKDYLFDTRNAYTHKALFAAGIHPSFGTYVPDGYAEWWSAREQWVDGPYLFTVFTKGWPDALAEAVRAGFAQYLRSLVDTDSETDEPGLP